MCWLFYVSMHACMRLLLSCIYYSIYTKIRQVSLSRGVVMQRTCVLMRRQLRIQNSMLEAVGTLRGMVGSSILTPGASVYKQHPRVCAAMSS